MPTKLKGLKVKKVDFVDEGANPDAHITLYKNKEGQPGQPQEEQPGGIWKLLSDLFSSIAKMKPEEIGKAVEKSAPVEKSEEAATFVERLSEREEEEKLQKVYSEIWDLCYALESSLCSILRQGEAAEEQMRTSLNEFTAVVSGAITQWAQGKTYQVTKKMAAPETELEKAVMKSLRDRLDSAISGRSQENQKEEEEVKGESEEMKIDKSKMTPAERAFYEEIEKRYGGTVETTGQGKSEEAAAETTEGVAKSSTSIPASQAEEPDSSDIYKGLNPAVAAELAELKKYREAAEEKELKGIAKRYELIGKKEEELLPLFKSLKAAGGTAFQDMLSVLDAAVAATEQSGIFSEIGKSGGNCSEPVEALAKARIQAAEIRKNRPELTEAQALDAAITANPELLKELDQ